MIKMNDNDWLSRKLKILNLNRCMNCSKFIDCKESQKEEISDCPSFDELPDNEAVVVVELGKCA